MTLSIQTKSISITASVHKVFLSKKAKLWLISKFGQIFLLQKNILKNCSVVIMVPSSLCTWEVCGLNLGKFRTFIYSFSEFSINRFHEAFFVSWVDKYLYTVHTRWVDTSTRRIRNICGPLFCTDLYEKGPTIELYSSHFSLKSWLIQIQKMKEDKHACSILSL